MVNIQGLINQERSGNGARALVRESFIVLKVSPTHFIANQDAYEHMAAVAAAAATSTNRKNGGTHTTNHSPTKAARTSEAATSANTTSA